MLNNFNMYQIFWFRREALERVRSTGVKLMTALSAIAMREGFENWSMLMQHSVARPETCLQIVQGIIDTARLADELNLFIVSLNDSDVWNLVEKEGSIWIKLDEITSGKFSIDSLMALGPRYSRPVRRYAYEKDAVLLFDLSGISKLFAIEFNGKCGRIQDRKFLFTVNYVRSIILSAIEDSMDRDYEMRCALLDELLFDYEMQTVTKVFPSR